MKNSIEALQEALQNYFDGLYESDVLKLGAVFHPSAIYVCATEERLKYLTMEEYFPIVKKRPSPQSRGEKRTDEIVSIEFAGPKTAWARVKCSIGEKHFDDLLSFIYQEGRWQIISKVFHYQTR